MPDSWQPLTNNNQDYTWVTNLANTASGGINTIATVLDLTAGAIRLLSVIAQSFENPLVALLTGIVEQLRETIEDILQNNVAATIHTNLSWNPDWTYKDYLESGSLPVAGGGFEGWVQEVFASTEDPLDPFRPLADDQTEVQGLVLVLTIPDVSALSSLQDALKVLLYTDDFRYLVETFIEDIKPDDPILRMGAGMGSEFMRAFSAQADLALNGKQFVPKLGATPTWYSIPVAALIPPLAEVFSTLERLIAALDPGPAYDALERLAQALELRSQALEQLASALERLAEILVALLSILSGSNLLVLGSESGGLPRFFERVLQAENPPDGGPGAIVSGIVGISTTDDPADSWNKLLQLIKIGYVPPDNSELYTQLDETYDPITGPR